MKVKHLTLKEIPACERPYEKFLKLGAAALTDTELLAIILKTGNRNATSIELARRILELKNGEYSVLSLHQKTMKELMELPGIGRVKAITLKCVVELSKRISLASLPKTIVVTSPKLLADYYMESMRHLKYEQLRVAFLNSASKLLGETIISSGTVNQSLVSSRDIFLKAMEFEAVYMIMVHNHPGGNPAPSRQDILVTKKIKEAGNIMDIQLVDHVIIGDNCYISLKEAGLF